MTALYEKLCANRDSTVYGFHMPGHKRNEEMTGVDLPYGIDITEIDGFDDLHHADGILKDAQELAAKIYHSEESHYLVNGSTSGILSAILGSTRKGDRILISRNCHKSIYHAIMMNELQAEYIYPEYDTEQELNGEVDPEKIRAILEQDRIRQSSEPKADAKNRIQAVVIVSPTYDGVVSDVRQIAKIAHEYDCVLIVDEAHGAHFGFHPYFPENANTKGADVVIHSLHKTLPSLTQTALLHLNGERADRESIRMYLHMLQTSSPSYVLMASMDACIQMLATRCDQIFDPYVEILEGTRKKLRKLKKLKLVETKHYDRSKIVISTRGTKVNGAQLSQWLREHYQLEMEMAAGNYIIAMTTVGDRMEGMNRLVEALYEIDQNVEVCVDESKASYQLPELESCYSSARIQAIKQESYASQQQNVQAQKEVREEKQAKEEEIESREFFRCTGYISTEYAYLYPPGIPIVVPGERLNEEAVELLMRYHENGFEIQGLHSPGKIRVIKR